MTKLTKLSTEDEKRILRLSDSKLARDIPELKLIAHRGLSALAPENTLPALELAGEFGYYGAEFDIYPTKDGVWVVMHNNDVEKMTDGAGKVIDFTYAEIQALTIDDGSNVSRYHGLKMPTFEQALDVCEKYGMVPVIEIKDGRGLFMEEFARIIRERDLEKRATVISFHSSALVAAKAVCPGLSALLLVGSFDESTVDVCRANGFDGVDFEGKSQLLEAPSLIDDVKAKGLTLCAWTVDDLNELDRLAKHGVRLITTNKIIPE